MTDHIEKTIQVSSVALLLTITGCATYGGIVRPTPDMAPLSPEAAKLTDAEIEAFLRVSARPEFPAVLAVARLDPARRYSRKGNGGRYNVEPIHDQEADAWRRFVDDNEIGQISAISQVHFINGLAVSGEPTLENLREAAARLHAPMLLAYVQQDEHAEGLNPAAMAYWTIAAMFFVPGNTVGHHSVCEGIIVDTRTGAIMATVAAEAKREENVLPGAVSIARKRTREQARTEAVERFQNDFRRMLNRLTEPTKTVAPNGHAPRLSRAEE